MLAPIALADESHLAAFLALHTVHAAGPAEAQWRTSSDVLFVQFAAPERLTKRVADAPSLGWAGLEALQWPIQKLALAKLHQMDQKVSPALAVFVVTAVVVEPFGETVADIAAGTEEGLAEILWTMLRAATAVMDTAVVLDSYVVVTVDGLESAPGAGSIH